MYVGKKYTATKVEHRALEYHCKHCDHTVDVVVAGVGMGQGQSPYFLDNQGAAERAGERAAEDAVKNAELTLKLWPCPRCGKRDSAGFIAESVIALLASAALPWGIGALMSSMGKRGALWIFWVSGALVPFLVYYYAIHWKWTTVKNRVMTVEELEKKVALLAAAEEARPAKPRRTRARARRRPDDEPQENDE